MSGLVTHFCRVCGDYFSEPVWHCPTPGCNHHWLMARDYCANCHEIDCVSLAPSTTEMSLTREQLIERLDAHSRGHDA